MRFFASNSSGVTIANSTLYDFSSCFGNLKESKAAMILCPNLRKTYGNGWLLSI